MFKVLVPEITVRVTMRHFDRSDRKRSFIVDSCGVKWPGKICLAKSADEQSAVIPRAHYARTEMRRSAQEPDESACVRAIGVMHARLVFVASRFAAPHTCIHPYAHIHTHTRARKGGTHSRSRLFRIAPLSRKCEFARSR